jgi:CheY-like chemotaxis protein
MHCEKRILVIDDEPSIRELIAEALGEDGFQVRVAANGGAAFEVMRRWPPHVIVLDLMMPRLDGIAFINLLRLNPEFESIPVLLVTAAYEPDEVAERIGARACLSKPFELDRLVQLVAKLTESSVPV